MRTSDNSPSEPDDPDKYIWWSGSSYSSSWYSDSETDCNLLSMQLLSEGWTGVGGVNEGPADDGAAVAFPPLDVVGICSMTTTFIRLPLVEGRRSPFFFNLAIFARAVYRHGTRYRGRRTLTSYYSSNYATRLRRGALAQRWPVRDRDINDPSRATQSWWYHGVPNSGEQYRDIIFTAIVGRGRIL